MVERVHITSGDGPPAFDPTSAAEHYIDDLSGEHYLSTGPLNGPYDWSRTIAYQDEYSGPPMFAPSGPAMFVANGVSPYRVWISVKAAGEAWEWLELATVQA